MTIMRGNREHPVDYASPLWPPSQLFLSCTVIGTPIPQGSQRAFNRKGGGHPIVTSDNVKTRPWKDAVAWNAAAHLIAKAGKGEPVSVQLHFRFIRPASHYGKGGNLLPSAPARPTTRPDVDKLVRAVFDALKEAQVYADDAQVVTLTTTKAYADDLAPGVSIEVWAA